MSCHDTGKYELSLVTLVALLTFLLVAMPPMLP